MNSELEKLKGPIEYIREAWVIYSKRENFIFFAKIMAILVIISTLVNYLINYLYPTPNVQVGFILLSLISTIFGFWYQTVTYFSVIKMGDSEKKVFKLGSKYLIKFILISLVVGLIILGGAILLVIPAIIFAVWYSFSTLLTLDKNMGIKEALKTSKLMVKDKFFKILGRSVVFGLFMILISIFLSTIPYGVGRMVSSFVTPFFILPYFLLYRDLSGTN